jgi:uncharacterized membrane protein YidH (DUF202 family)
MEGQIESAVKRGRGYWFVDGFTEMITGGLFLVLGGAVLLRGIAPQDSFLAQFSSIVNEVSLIKIIGIIGGIIILWWAKNRFTYPRTGFVRGKRLPWGRIWILVGILVLVVIVKLLLLAAIFSLVPSTRGWIFSLPIWLPIGLAALWAFLFVFSGVWMGLRRFLPLGAWIFLAGIGVGIWQLTLGLPSVPFETLQFNLWGPLPEVSRIPIEETIHRIFAGLGLLTLATGMAFSLSGGMTFLRYRKENPVPFREEA